MPSFTPQTPLQHVSVDSLDVRYIELNPTAKKTLLMVHGFRGNSGGLLQIANLLPYRILIPDLPGHGETPPMQHQHDVDGFAQFIRHFMQALNLKKIDLLGHSFGALIAAKVVVDSSQGIEKLILVNPVSESNKQLAALGIFYYRLGLGLPEKVGHRLLSSRLINRLNSHLMMKTTDKVLRKAIYQHHLSDLDLPYYRSVISEAVDSALSKDVLGFASAIDLPTLLIAGELDDLAPLPSQKRLHAMIPGSKLSVIAGVGHLTHLETPAEVAEVIEHYLATDASLEVSA